MGKVLAEKLELELDSKQTELLEIITDFNMEARYPDEKFTFYKRCTNKFTKEYMDKIKDIKAWLRQMI